MQLLLPHLAERAHFVGRPRLQARFDALKVSGGQIDEPRGEKFNKKQRNHKKKSQLGESGRNLPLYHDGSGVGGSGRLVLELLRKLFAVLRKER